MAKIYTKVRTITDTIKIKKGTISEDGTKISFVEDDVDYEVPISDVFKPFTTSDSSGGGQAKDDSDLTDDGEASRDKRDNSN